MPACGAADWVYFVSCCIPLYGAVNGRWLWQVRARRAKAAAAERSSAAAERSSAEEEAYLPHSVAGSPQNSGAALAPDGRHSLDLPPAFLDSDSAQRTESLLPAWGGGGHLRRQLSAASAAADGHSGSSSPAVTPRQSVHGGPQLKPTDVPISISAAMPVPKRLSPELLARAESASSPRPLPRAPESHPLSQLDLLVESAADASQQGFPSSAAIVIAAPQPAAADLLGTSQHTVQAAQAAKPEQPLVQQGWVPSLILPAPEPRLAKHPGFEEPEVVRSSGSGVGAAPRAASDRVPGPLTALPSSLKVPQLPPPPSGLIEKSVPRPPPPPPPPAQNRGPRPPPPPAPPPAAAGKRSAAKVPSPAMSQSGGPVLAMQPRVKLRGLFWSKSDKRQDTVWDVVGKGKVPMEEDHLAALEALFPAISAGPVARTGGDGERLPHVDTACVASHTDSRTSRATSILWCFAGSKKQEGGVQLIPLSRANNVSIMLTQFSNFRRGPQDIRRAVINGELGPERLSLLLQVLAGRLFLPMHANALQYGQSTVVSLRCDCRSLQKTTSRKLVSSTTDVSRISHHQSSSSLPCPACRASMTKSTC